MDRQIINIEEESFLLINGPLIVFSIAANIFYAWCLFFGQPSKRRLKQPLKTLLTILVSCSLIYCFSLVSMYILLREHSYIELTIVSWVIVLYALNSMSCYVWLNFYYYIQIVPAQRALLIWIKKNIKSFIYGLLITDAILSIFSCTIFAADALLFNWSFNNGTWINLGSGALSYLYVTSDVIVKVHILICLCIMMVSSISTARYLHGHMRDMIQSGSFSTPKLHSQIRVTITGVFQGVLCFLYDTFYLIDTFIFFISTEFFFSSYVSFTATTLYVSGTTFNLGIGQAIFRQSAADLWKALKAALCGVGMATDNVKIHSADSR